MARLGEAGSAVIHNPAFEIARAPESVLRERIDGLAAFDAVIVTSPVAARLIAERAIVPGMRDVGFFAPGKGTASLLHAAGLRCRFPVSGGTSEHILAMRELAEVEGARIVIVGAPGGRGLLASALDRRGADVEVMHVYRRQPLSPTPALISALRKRHDLVVLISSRQAFSIITDALGKELSPGWLDSRFVVSSGRLERVCRDAGVSRICTAAGAADEQMLAAARKAGWARDQGFGGGF